MLYELMKALADPTARLPETWPDAQEDPDLALYVAVRVKIIGFVAQARWLEQRNEVLLALLKRREEQLSKLQLELMKLDRTAEEVGLG